MQKVKEWGREKGLHDPIMQFTKYMEENGEIAHELTRNKLASPELVDAIGDSLICHIILADILGIDTYEALSSAFEVVSKRTGKTVNGSFIKDENA